MFGRRKQLITTAVLISALGAGLAVTPTVFAASTTSTKILATDDGYTFHNIPDETTAGYRMLRVGGTDQDRMAFVKFDVPSYSANEKVTLSLKANASYKGTVQAYLADQNVWTGKTLKNSNKPGASTPVGTVNNIANGSTVTFDVSKVTTKSGTYSFMLASSPLLSNAASFVSVEGGTPPWLTVTAAPKPTTTTVKPTTTTAKPKPTTTTTAKPTTTTTTVKSTPTTVVTVPKGAPNASNTGVPASTKLTVHTGDITVTQDGTHLDSMDIHGYVIIKAKNVTISNSIVRGDDNSTPTYNTALINCNAAGISGIVIDHVTLVPTKPNLWIDGVIGHDYSANAVNVYNTVDGFGVYNSTGDKKYTNVNITNSYIHDLSAFAHDPNHGGGGTHNDGIQVQGGRNITITGNNVQAFKSQTAGDVHSPIQAGQGILLQQNASNIGNITVEYNWVDGGGASISVQVKTPKFNGAIDVGTIAYNKIGHNQLDYGNGSKYPLRVDSKADAIFDQPLTTNTWTDGTPLAVGRDLGIRYDS